MLKKTMLQTKHRFFFLHVIKLSFEKFLFLKRINYLCSHKIILPMKKILLSFIFITFLWSCEELPLKEIESKKTYSLGNNQGLEITEFTIDGCEYIGDLSGDSRSRYLTHKGNCKNPIHKCK
jgi:hypothetical protein